MTQSIYFPLFQLLFFALPPILAAVLCLIINRRRIGTKQMPELKAKENSTKLIIGLIISAAVVAAGLLLEKFRHELFGGAMEQVLPLLTNASIYICVALFILCYALVRFFFVKSK